MEAQRNSNLNKYEKSFNNCSGYGCDPIDILYIEFTYTSFG